MNWFENSAKESEIVLYSKVQFARNLADYPFPAKLSKIEKEQLNQLIKSALENNGELNFIEMKNLSKHEIISLAEKQLISPEFASSPAGRALLISNDESISTMLMEEDHVKIQAILPGLQIDEAFESAAAVEERLDKAFQLAFNEKLGYLTQSPTNLGTAMRVSVMMHLPALSIKGEASKLSSTVSKLGISLRPTYNERGSAIGDLYTLSNQVTLGISEQQAIKNLYLIASQIVSQEKKAREGIKENNQLLDKIHRSYGILKNAWLLSATEMANLISLVRLGASEGILDINTAKLTALFINMQSATLSANEKQDFTATERELVRAERIRNSI